MNRLFPRSLLRYPKVRKAHASVLALHPGARGDELISLVRRHMANREIQGLIEAARRILLAARVCIAAVVISVSPRRRTRMARSSCSPHSPPDDPAHRPAAGLPGSRLTPFVPVLGASPFQAVTL